MGEDRTTTLWRPTGAAELDLVKAAGYRAWPPRLPEQPIFYPVLNRWYATKIAREWNVPERGVGYVTAFDVREDFLAAYPVQQAGGRDVLEYWIPAEDLESLNANIVGVVRIMAEYQAPVSNAEFHEAEIRLGRRFPAPWREFLQQRSWFHRGTLESGCTLSLYRPSETQEAHRTWKMEASDRSLLIMGDTGGGTCLALDLRSGSAQVVLSDTTIAGCSATVPQAASIEDFVAGIEDGTFQLASRA